LITKRRAVVLITTMPIVFTMAISAIPKASSSPVAFTMLITHASSRNAT
jgi:hypothetical protein